MLIWNVGTTWWMCNSTIPGGIAAMLANSLLMCLPWLAYFQIKRRLGRTPGHISLIAFWLVFEYIHLNWQLSWPWLTVGNVFASKPGWVQWYEFTGSSGGTLWVMLVNILIAETIFRYNQARSVRVAGPFGFASIVLVTFPLIISFFIGHSNKQAFAKVPRRTDNIVLVQPNIDPYEKFEAGMQEGQLKTLIDLSEAKMDSQTSLVIWPETAVNLPGGIEVDRLKEYQALTPLWTFLRRHPNTVLLTGIEAVRFYNRESRGRYAQKLQNSDYYYDMYNAASTLNEKGATAFYQKSKLVPGVETLPSFLHFLDTWFEQFGGTTGGYAPQEERTVFSNLPAQYKIAPAICYESIYGEFLSSYIKNGANLIVIITNDGWWANTSGHKQHMQYARLRAIETRRWIARSANTGISCFISPLGEILQPQPWDIATSIKGNVSTYTQATFFVTYGDLISLLAIVTAIMITIWCVFHRLKYSIPAKSDQKKYST
jgi:apolipoprotein N-acyltransferase